MLKFLTLSLAMVAMASSAIVPRQLSCEECIKEMHSIDMFVKLGAEAIEEFLKVNYCGMMDEEHFEQCQQDLAGSYVEMLYMISHHYFNDGAIHVCEAAGICDVRSQLIGNGKEPRP